jgi:hypothetical protein
MGQMRHATFFERMASRKGGKGPRDGLECRGAPHNAGHPAVHAPVDALVQAGAGMDVAGRGYDQFTATERQAVVAAFPREADFEDGIIDAFYHGMKHRPDSTFGTFNNDVLAYKDPHFCRIDICTVIHASKWHGSGQDRGEKVHSF